MMLASIAAAAVSKKAHHGDEMTLSSKETKPVEQAIIDLHLSESIVVSHSVNQ